MTLLDSDGTYRQYQGLTEDPRRVPILGRHIDGRNMVNNTLGRRGSGLELTDIFDPTHGSNYDNITRLFGQGSTKYLDIKASPQDGLRIGGGNQREPYLVNPIPNSGRNSIRNGYNRDLLYNGTLDDIERFLKYHSSPRGLLKLLKENVTNINIGEDIDIYNPFGWTMAPSIPIPMTGFLNFYQQAGQKLGRPSIRKPFTGVIRLIFGNILDLIRG